eukprot:ANDGO_06725.mRNA.1 Katanin p80 WD40 repeat-containing subunit B1 homolog
MQGPNPIAKIQEFVAHLSQVNCAHIGRRSSQVLVTGGADKRVSLWTIGKPDAVLSLAQHASSVTSVRFDQSEENVLAGTEGGLLKLWDLASQKGTSFSGHRSAVEACEVHPFVSQVLASGSRDTQVKVWDGRRKSASNSSSSSSSSNASSSSASCLCTLRGHTSPVTAVRFTPDGRWIVSGAEDGAVRVWDLAAGKCLAEFASGHSNTVTCIDFHPQEFLMVTGGADRRLVFWDLETLTQLGVAETHPSRIRAAEFSPDGSCCLAATQESLRTWCWEPVVESADWADARWGSIVDLHTCQSATTGQFQTLAVSTAQSFVSVWACNTNRLAPFSASSYAQNFAASVASASAASVSPAAPVSSAGSAQSFPQPSSYAAVDRDRRSAAAQDQPLRRPSNSQPNVEIYVPKTDPSQRQPSHSQPSQSYQSHTSASNLSSAYAISNLNVNDGYAAQPQYSQPSRSASSSSSSSSTHASDGGDMSGALPADPNRLFSEIASPHERLVGVLTSRLTHVRAVNLQWQRGDVKGAMDALVLAQRGSPDEAAAIAVDVLKHIDPSHLTLDLGIQLLGIATSILASPAAAKFEDYALSAVDTARQIWIAFRETINTTLAHSFGSPGVDLSREARIEKCKNAKKLLDQVASRVDSWKGEIARRGDAARSFLEAYNPATE